MIRRYCLTIDLATITSFVECTIDAGPGATPFVDLDVDASYAAELDARMDDLGWVFVEAAPAGNLPVLRMLATDGSEWDLEVDALGVMTTSAV